MGNLFSLNDRKPPYRFGYIQTYPTAPSELIFLYLSAFDEAMANNTPDKMVFKPMPKAGALLLRQRNGVLLREIAGLPEKSEARACQQVRASG